VLGLKFPNLRRGRSTEASAPGGAKDQLLETLTLLRRYVVQETIAPLRHLAKVLGLGAAGAVAFGVGGLFLLVGTLRVIQAESGRAFAGNWGFLPYLLAALVGLCALALFGAMGLKGISRRGRAKHTPEEL
jgi:hypothetical protein